MAHRNGNEVGRNGGAKLNLSVEARRQLRSGASTSGDQTQELQNSGTIDCQSPQGGLFFSQGLLSRELPVERLFILLSLLFGLPLICLIAPFQAADEPHHFLRAYQVSEGGWVSVRSGSKRGGLLPVSLASVAHSFGRLKPPAHNITNLNEILVALRVPLHPDDRAFTPFVAAIYSPVAYVPQAAAMAMGRRLGLGPLLLMYSGRFANLLTWIMFGAAAIRLAPDLKLPLLLLLMMPVSLFQAASLSADVTTNGLAVLFTALVWRTATAGKWSCEQDGHVVKWPVLVGLGFSSALLSIAKFAYLPLAGLVMLISTARFAGRRRRIIAIAFLASVNVLAMCVWTPQTDGLDTEVRSLETVSPRRQLDYIERNPVVLITIPFATIGRDFFALLKSFVGRPGSGDIKMSFLFIIGYVTAMVLACRPKDRVLPDQSVASAAIIIVGAATLSFGAVGLLNYLYWTPVGAACVDGLQGRYLVPLAPSMILLLRSVWRPDRVFSHHYHSAVSLIYGSVAAFSGGYTVLAVWLRYF